MKSPNHLPNSSPSPSAQPGGGDRAPVPLRRDKKFAILNSLALVGALSALTGTPKVLNPEIDNPFSGEDPVTHTESHDRNTTPHTGTVTLKRENQEEVRQDDFEIADGVWARLFAADKDAGKLASSKELEPALDRIESCIQGGFTVEEIILQGHASGEDDTLDAHGQPTGGLGADSVNNLQTANARVRGTRSEFREGLEDRGLADDVPAEFTVANLVEHMPTKSERADVRKLADDENYARVATLLQDFNRGKQLSKITDKELTELLVKNRYTSVTIKCKKPISTETKISFSHDSGGSHITGTETQEPGNDDTIQVPLPLLLLLLLRKRRQEEVSAISGEPTPFVHQDKKDALFQQPSTNHVGAESQQVRRIHKQPRPHNMHGSANGNYHLSRSRGGDRRGRR